MNISYNWLKEYVNFDLTPDETAAALTSIGLETGGVEEVQTIKGGLEGLVIGEVLTCTEHPNSDHLHITTVNLGVRCPESLSAVFAVQLLKGNAVVKNITGCVERTMRMRKSAADSGCQNQKFMKRLCGFTIS